MKKTSDAGVLLVDDTKSNLDILVQGLKSDHKLSLVLKGEFAFQTRIQLSSTSTHSFPGAPNS